MTNRRRPFCNSGSMKGARKTKSDGNKGNEFFTRHLSVNQNRPLHHRVFVDGGIRFARSRFHEARAHYSCLGRALAAHDRNSD